MNLQSLLHTHLSIYDVCSWAVYREFSPKCNLFCKVLKKGKESVSSTDWGQNLQKRDWLQTEAAKSLRLRWHFCAKSLLQRTEPQRREWYKQDLTNLAWAIFVTMITMTILMFQSSPLLHIWCCTFLPLAHLQLWGHRCSAPHSWLLLTDGPEHCHRHHHHDCQHHCHSTSKLNKGFGSSWN